MRCIYKYLIINIVSLLCACGSDDKFTLQGTLAGGETQSLRFVYYSDGALRVIPGAARDGEFKVEGAASVPTVVDILSNDGHVIGRVYVANGDKIKCELNRMAPWNIKLEGTEANSRWAGFIRANSEVLKNADTLAFNRAIAEYIAKHTDDVVSTLLLVTSYDARRNPKEATRLLEKISPVVRPMSLVDGLVTQLSAVSSRHDSIDRFRYYIRRDTLEVFETRRAEVSLLAFSDAPDGTKRADSILNALRSVHKRYKVKEMQMLDLSLDVDSFAWKRSMRADSATWKRGWLPGSVATKGLENVAVALLPWFVVADSGGLIVYRGSSVTDAVKAVDDALK